MSEKAASRTSVESVVRLPIDEKLEGIRYCIANGHEEDAHEHILDLLRGLRLKSKADSGLTPNGMKLKSLWKSNNE